MIRPVALIVFACLLGSCSLKASLPNQLQLVELWGSTFAITNGTDFVVQPDITRLSCRNSVVLGYVESLEDAPTQTPPDFGAEPGFFILDSASTSLQQGLSPADFRKRLKEMNIEEVEPKPIESFSRVIFGLDGC
jgi:hypothetical protein